SFVRSRSSAPARTMCSTGTSQLLDDFRDVLRAHRLAVAMVDRHDRAPAAAACTLDRPQRDEPVLGRLARPHAELLLERLDDLLRADQRARHVRADLDQMPADGLEVEHVVEG